LRTSSRRFKNGSRKAALKVSSPGPPSSTRPGTQPDHTTHVRPGWRSYRTRPRTPRPTQH